MFTLDTALREYCTPRQLELLEAWETHGSQRKAADALGTSKNVFPQALAAATGRAAQRGYSPDHDYTRPVPDGYKVRGVSTYYDKEGEAKGQWVKSERDKDRQAEMFEAMVAGLSDTLPRVTPIEPVELDRSGDLMACYPVGDHHLGMLSWDKETGDDWDLKIAENMLNKATDHLVAASPNAASALVVFLGDFMHYDSFEPVTPSSRNQLDADGRFPKMVRVAIRTMRYLIDAALMKHGRVHVIIEIGNHDLSSSIWLMEAMRCIYENEPRVSLDTSPMHFHYHQFGKNLIGVHHGHGTKMAQLPLTMAADRPKEWGETTHRIWLTGHVHHSKTQAAIGAQDFSGCSVETFRILAPADAWAHQKAYRAQRDMKSIIFHREYGEVARNTVNPEMFGC
jgi:hypothetical protein